MVFGPATIDADVFEVWQPLDTIVFQWFPMVANHWSNDGMGTIHRYGLLTVKYTFFYAFHKLKYLLELFFAHKYGAFNLVIIS